MKYTEFDYWMLEIIEKALKSYEKDKCFTTRGKKIYRENKNPYNRLGQIRVIEERTRKIRETFDAEIKKALKNHNKQLVVMKSLNHR